MKNILFILTLFSLGLVSCEDFFSQTVEIDPPPYTKQLSFHVNLTDQDSIVYVTLTRNFGILETVPDYNDYYVKGGTVELYKDGTKWLTLGSLPGDSTYIMAGMLPEPLQSGSTYEIRAEHPDFPKVSSVQVMPGDFTVDSARIKLDAISGQFGDRFDLVEVFLKDPPGVRNYYEITLKSVYYYVVQDPITGEPDTLGLQEDTRYVDEYPDPNIQQGVQSGGLLSDQFFDGQTYKFQAKLYSGSSYGELYVHVRNITEDYYRWSRSYQAKFDSEDNPLVEPVSVFNNLVDGLGIFSVAREKVFKAKQ